jgi:triphosphatase
MGETDGVRLSVKAIHRMASAGCGADRPLPYAGPMKTPSPGRSSAAAPREIELKLALAADELPRLRRRLARFGAGASVEVDSVYFDTAERLLRADRMALRLRRIGRRWLQTLKTEAAAGALSSRGEWEVPAPRGRLDVGRFGETPLGVLLQAHPEARLQPVFRTRFRRTVWLANDGAIEVSLDEGEIVAGERRAPILELELELKAGGVDALYRLALALAGRGADALALRPAVDSKAMRGYRLAAAEAAAPLKANAGAVVGGLSRGSTLAAALRRVVERGTTLLLANAGGSVGSEDPEFVHQARVAVRRMRSAARLLGRAAGWPAALDRDLRWIGRRLGAVRDWDVLQAHTLPALLAALPAAKPLATRAAQARRRDEAALSSALAAARYARLALRLLRWANTPAEDGPTLASAAGKRLARLHRRLFDAAAFFAVLPVQQQHRVRIRAKRLRYALDLFAGALPAKATRRYVEQLARLQDELGALNDVAVATGLVPALARAGGVDPKPALDWLEQQHGRCALRAEAALAGLAGLPRPWD